MAVNYIPNDPRAGATAPAMRSKTKHANRPTSRAKLTFAPTTPEGTFAPGTPQFLFWQCREAGLAAIDAWESVSGNFMAWQGARKSLPLRQDVGVDLNAFYDRASFQFFHAQAGGDTFFSGASTDVVAHEIGHGLLDAIRPDLWDAPFLETGAFHEAFGDCVAVLTALHDLETRQKLLSVTSTLKKKNFVESTAEDLSEAIRRIQANHSAAEPRHAFNTFQYQIPETLPSNGGPGSLINEVHSFGMLFSGCFYDLIVKLFAAQSWQTPASLLAATKTAGALLVGAAKGAQITPRFLQSVGRAMVLADDQLNSGANRDRIRLAFEGHNILLGTNAMLAPSAVLAGGTTRGAMAPAARRDLADRLGLPKGTPLSMGASAIPGRQVSETIHTQRVSLSSLDSRLKGVTVSAPVSTLIGATRGRAVVLGAMAEPVSTEREVHAFVESLLAHGQVQFGNAPAAPAAVATRGAVRGAAAGVTRAAIPVGSTHRVRTVRGAKVLERVRFHCFSCGHSHASRAHTPR